MVPGHVLRLRRAISARPHIPLASPSSRPAGSPHTQQEPPHETPSIAMALRFMTALAIGKGPAQLPPGARHASLIA